MNKKIKEILEIQEDADYKKLSIEDILLIKEYIPKLQQCYCNRTDCSARIKDSKKYDSLQQRIDKAIKFIKEELFFEDPFGEGEHTFLEDINTEYYEDLLNILQGSDKE